MRQVYIVFSEWLGDRVVDMIFETRQDAETYIRDMEKQNCQTNIEPIYYTIQEKYIIERTNK